ncbi:MAG: glycoside hydrolase family 25 protein [Armatimonadota bacterium]
MGILGIDIYHGNGTHNWPALYKAGVRFAYVKLSQGASLKDPRGVSNVAAARAAGVIVGAYHYFSPASNAGAQYENFKEQVALCGGFDGMLPPALDVEGDMHQKIAPMTSEQYTTSALAWLSYLENDTGIRGVVYTYKSFASEIIKGKLAGYRLWASSIHEAGKPSSFVGWGDQWFLHQWTTTGAPNGVPVGDQDYFAGTIEQLRDLLIGRPKTKMVMVVDWETGEKVTEYKMVENGDHIADAGKLYVIQ